MGAVKMDAEKAGREFKKAINSEDVPLENRAPSVSFGMVGLSYMIILALFGFGVALFLYFL
jgi:hypothetical protein